jgi:quinolinate synthase
MPNAMQADPREAVRGLNGPSYVPNGNRFETWYEDFNRYAGDLYEGRYTRDYVKDLVGIGNEVRVLAAAKGSLIVAHNYQYPELQEVAAEVGDSLGLSQYVAQQDTARVDFCGVWFMGETAKTIVGDRGKVYMPDKPGCSLVESIDHERIKGWMARNPEAVIISYVNTDAKTKALSDYVCTSRNAAQVLQHAADTHPGRRILFLPDKYLGSVALAQSTVDPDRVDLYDGACHVHAKIGENALESAFDRYPDAELLLHPECGCSTACLAKTVNGSSPYAKSYFLSTEQMLHHARGSSAREFVVGTEAGMLYRLRKLVPDKTFHPISYEAMCEYMKMNTLEKLRDSLEFDRIEVTVDPEVREGAQAAIQRMLTIQ